MTAQRNIPGITRSLDITMLLLALSVTLAAVVLAQNDVELTFQPPGEPGGLYKKGAYVTINCKAKEEVFDLMKIVKTDSEGNQHVISTNDFLEDPFGKASRYALMASSTTSGGQEFSEISIAIRQLEGADRGGIECQHILLDGTTYVASEEFHVQVPLKSVEILQYQDGKQSAVEDGKIILREGEDHGIICKVKVEDSEDNPTVSIKMGEESVKDMFSVDEEKTVTGPDGLAQHNNTQTYEYLTPDPSISHNGKTLTCSGTMPGFEDAPLSDSVDIEVHYAPRVECEPADAETGELNIEIKCQGQTNPEVELVSMSWTRNPDNHVINLDEPDFERHHLKMEASEDGKYDITVTIDEVLEGDFGIYVLEVQNAHSPITKEIELVKVVPTTASTSTLTTTPVPETKTDSSSAKPISEGEEVVNPPYAGPIKDNSATSMTSHVLMTCLALLAATLLHWS